ncbi:MAG: hypothetical protein R3231_05215, partial [bacterium]|nr:hypothetical protein [bacterium]
NGVAFRKGALYIADVNRILRYDRIDDQLLNPPNAAIVTDRCAPRISPWLALHRLWPRRYALRGCGSALKCFQTR